MARLMSTHEGLVRAIVRQRILGHLPFAEAVQEGCIGLWRSTSSTLPRSVDFSHTW
jgi:hypothetical protein